MTQLVVLVTVVTLVVTVSSIPNEGIITYNVSNNRNNTHHTTIEVTNITNEFKHIQNEDTHVSPVHTTNDNDSTTHMRPTISTVHELLQKMSRRTLRKCYCPAKHVLREDSCEPSKTSPIDILVQPLTSESINVSESFFLNVAYGNFNCRAPKQILHLYQADYVLLPSGDLRSETHDTIIKPEQFCMENIHYTNDIKKWVAIACVDLPQVPRCCSNTQEFDTISSKCQEKRVGKSVRIDASVQFSPPVETHHSSVDVDFISLQGLPNCSNDEQLTWIKLGNYSGNLVRLINSLDDIKLQVVHSDVVIQKFYKNNEYCISGPKSVLNNTDDYLAVFCYKNPFDLHHVKCSQGKNCIRKCCQENEVIDMISLKCTPAFNQNYVYSPQFYKTSWTTDLAAVSSMLPHAVVYGEPLCNFIDAQYEDFYLLDDGSVYFSRDSKRVTSEYYCVDNRQGYKNQVDVVIHYCPWKSLPYGDSCWRVRVELYPPMLVISCLFLLMTLIVYMIVPELHVYLSGKSLVSHIFALLVALVGILIIFMGDLSSGPLGLCQFMAFLTLFSLLATFFWLNVMCFEMWVGIRFLQPRPCSAYESRQKYRLYCVYGWGGPAVITAITAVVQYSVTVTHDASPLLPKFGYPYCWFKDEPAHWLYYSGIVLLLTIADIFFFFDLVHISLAQCLSSKVIHTSRPNHMGRIVLCLKLFLVMGVTWVFDEISYQHGGCAAWIPTDLVNILRGPFVFLSVVSSRTVINKVSSRLRGGVKWIQGWGDRLLRAIPRGPEPPHHTGGPTHPVGAHTTLRESSEGRHVSESGSRLSFLRTEETSIEAKSEVSVTSKPEVAVHCKSENKASLETTPNPKTKTSSEEEERPQVKERPETKEQPEFKERPDARVGPKQKPPFFHASVAGSIFLIQNELKLDYNVDGQNTTHDGKSLNSRSKDFPITESEADLPLDQKSPFSYTNAQTVVTDEILTKSMQLKNKSTKSEPDVVSTQNMKSNVVSNPNLKRNLQLESIQESELTPEHAIKPTVFNNLQKQGAVKNGPPQRAARNKSKSAMTKLVHVVPSKNESSFDLNQVNPLVKDEILSPDNYKAKPSSNTEPESITPLNMKSSFICNPHYNDTVHDESPQTSVNPKEKIEFPVNGTNFLPIEIINPLVSDHNDNTIELNITPTKRTKSEEKLDLIVKCENNLPHEVKSVIIDDQISEKVEQCITSQPLKKSKQLLDLITNTDNVVDNKVKVPFIFTGDVDASVPDENQETTVTPENIQPRKINIPSIFNNDIKNSPREEGKLIALTKSKGKLDLITNDDDFVVNKMGDHLLINNSVQDQPVSQISIKSELNSKLTIEPEFKISLEKKLFSIYKGPNDFQIKSTYTPVYSEIKSSLITENKSVSPLQTKASFPARWYKTDLSSVEQINKNKPKEKPLTHLDHSKKQPLDKFPFVPKINTENKANLECKTDTEFLKLNQEINTDKESKDNLKPKSNLEPAMKMESKISQESKTTQEVSNNLDSRTSLGPVPSIDSSANQEHQNNQESKTNPKSKTDFESKNNVQPKVNVEDEINVQPKTKLESKNDIELDNPKLEIKTDLEPNETKLEIKTDLEPNKTKLETKIDLEPEIRQEAGISFESKVNHDPKIGLEFKINRDFKTSTEPETNVELKISLEAETDTPELEKK